jgi:disulfide bond formation protein DsbB
MRCCERTFNAIWILVISGVLGASLWVQFVEKEIPCPLCLLQRIAMISIGCAALLNLCCGIRAAHYSLALLASVFGSAVSLRQIALHVCPQFDTFGTPVLGFSLYTWAFLVFSCSIVAVALLMFFYKPQESDQEPKRLNGLDWCAVAALMFVTLFNVISALILCGFGLCDE